MYIRILFTPGASNLFENIVETVRNPLLVLDGGLSVHHANRAFLSFFRLELKEILGVHLFALDGGAWNVPALRILFEEKLPREHALEDFEIETIFPAAGPRNIVLNASLISRAPALPLLYLMAMEDVTQRRRDESANRELGMRLRRSNEELETFAQIASHDLQEPLRKIQAFSGRLVRQAGAALDEPALDSLNRIRQASERMQSLVDGLLALSRLETRHRNWEPVNLDRILWEVIKDLELRVAETGALVSVENGMPVVEADRTQMRQLFQNLLTNALKFRRTGGEAKIVVSREPCEQPNRCRIVVADNGIGFEMKHADRIFGVFERLHAREEYEGTGIGLALCRKIVARHGGAIQAEGRPGSGARFIVTLPEVREQGGTARD